MTTNNDVSKNHLHIIGETKFNEFKTINKFWSLQHAFVKDWANVFNSLHVLLQKEINLVESTFHNNTAGFRSSDGEVIISALSYISNTTQVFSMNTQDTFSKVMENLDSKLQTTRQAFKSAGYDLDGKQSKGKEVATESIVTSFYELSSIANLKFFQMGNTFIEESDKFHKLKEDLNKRLNANTFKQQTHAPYVDVTVNQILESENRTKRDLPRVIEMIQMHLIKNGLSSKGIFREATDSAKTIQEICLRMSATNFFELSPITTATVYKKHIFNEEQTNAIVGQINPTMTTTTPELISLLRTTVDQLPQEHNTIFKNVVRLSTNLAVCLTPSIFTIPDDENGPKTLAASLIIMRKYIEEFSSIFPRFADPTYQLGSERKRKTTPKYVDEKKQFLVRDNNVLDKSHNDEPTTVSDDVIKDNDFSWLEDEVIQPTDSKQRFIIGKRKEKQVQQSKVEDNNEEQNEEHIENHDDYQNEEYVENQDDYQGEEYLENFNEDQVNQEVEEQNDDIHEKYQNNQFDEQQYITNENNEQDQIQEGNEEDNVEDNEYLSPPPLTDLIVQSQKSEKQQKEQEQPITIQPVIQSKIQPTIQARIHGLTISSNSNTNTQPTKKNDNFKDVKRKTFHPKANDQNSTEDGSELMSLLSKRRGKLGDD
ncbi:RhoGAP domain containing protein [Entamoeba marina]